MDGCKNIGIKVLVSAGDPPPEWVLEKMREEMGDSSRVSGKFTSEDGGQWIHVGDERYISGEYPIPGWAKRYKNAARFRVVINRSGGDPRWDESICLRWYSENTPDWWRVEFQRGNERSVT